MLELEGNQPKEHNNSDNKNSKHFAFFFKFPGLDIHYRDTGNGKHNCMKSGGSIVFFLIQSTKGFSAPPTHTHEKKNFFKKDKFARKADTITELKKKKNHHTSETVARTSSSFFGYLSPA